MAILLTGCNPTATLFPPPAAKLQGIWGHAEVLNVGSNKQVAFYVLYFDGKASMSYTTAIAAVDGWTISSYGSYDGSYSISDNILAVSALFVSERRTFHVAGDRLYLSRVGSPDGAEVFVKTTQYPWVTHSNLQSVVRSGQIDPSVFARFINLK